MAALLCMMVCLVPTDYVLSSAVVQHLLSGRKRWGTKPISPSMLMWAGAIAWQIGYDTVYAYVDVRDDTHLGLKSTAILFGRHGKICIGLLYALAIGAWSLGGWLLDMSPLYAVGMLVIAAHLGWQTWKIDLIRPELNYRLFLANILTGVLLAGAAVIGTL